MKHFSTREWVDFVRGVAPYELTMAMQEHLDGGCQDCLKTVEDWKHVLACARSSSLERFLSSRYLN